MSINIDPTTTKYLIRADMSADGVVEKPDVVGAIFGQTEGLLGNELDLRDLQKSGRIGRIEVEVESKKGKSSGTITLPSSLDKVETAILASALESIDRVGPCKADIKVTSVEDVRVSKRKQVIDRAKEILHGLIEDAKDESEDITETVRQTVRVEEIVSYGSDKCPAGPNVAKSDSILVVEGRNDVLNLLRYGIKNAIAVEGTNIPKTIIDLTKERVATAFVDGDRGGELILKELLQTAEVDFIARAPRSREVEELTQKQIMKSLRNKIPAEQFVEMYSLDKDGKDTRDNVRGGGRGGKGGRGSNGGRQESKKESKGPSKPEPKKQEKPQQKPQQRQPKGGDGRSDDYVGILDELSGKLQAVLLAENGDRMGDTIAVRDLADTLKKEGGKVDAVVFDGVITQRLLDIAADKSINTLVGVKTGNITKKPSGVEILTRGELK